MHPGLKHQAEISPHYTYHFIPSHVASNNLVQYEMRMASPPRAVHVVPLAGTVVLVQEQKVVPGLVLRRLLIAEPLTQNIKSLTTLDPTQQVKAQRGEAQTTRAGCALKNHPEQCRLVMQPTTTPLVAVDFWRSPFMQHYVSDFYTIR